MNLIGESIPTKMHPIISGDYMIMSDNILDGNKRRDYTGTVLFKKRQLWEVKHLNFTYEDETFLCRRKEIVLYMSKKMFTRFFGKYELEFLDDENYIIKQV